MTDAKPYTKEELDYAHVPMPRPPSRNAVLDLDRVRATVAERDEALEALAGAETALRAERVTSPDRIGLYAALAKVERALARGGR